MKKISKTIRHNPKKSKILDAYGKRPVAFHASIARAVGGAIPGLYLCQLMYWSDKGKNSDWIYKTMAEIEAETCLTRCEQERARRVLRERGILKEMRKGMPAMLYFSINFTLLDAAIKNAENRQSRMPKTGTHVSRDSAGKFAGNRQTITEITQRVPESTLTGQPEVPSSSTESGGSDTSSPSLDQANSVVQDDVKKQDTGTESAQETREQKTPSHPSTAPRKNKYPDGYQQEIKEHLLQLNPDLDFEKNAKQYAVAINKLMAKADGDVKVVTNRILNVYWNEWWNARREMITPFVLLSKWEQFPDPPREKVISWGLWEMSA